ncbi:hypothetical protein D9M71_802020 [compost metagenome]
MPEIQRVDLRSGNIRIRQRGTGDINDQIFQRGIVQAAKTRMRGGDDADGIGSHSFILVVEQAFPTMAPTSRPSLFVQLRIGMSSPTDRYCVGKLHRNEGGLPHDRPSPTTARP